MTELTNCNNETKKIFRSYTLLKEQLFCLIFFQFILLRAFLGKNRNGKELILKVQVKENFIVLQKNKKYNQRALCQLLHAIAK